MRTERLLLRQFRDSDIQNVYNGLSHPEVIKYYGVSYDSLEATKIQMNWFSELEETGRGIWWALCSFDDREFYGGCGLNNVSLVHKHAEIGFWLLPEYWGKGILKTALPLVCNYAFDSMGLHRIEAQVETENKNSKKALTKFLFEYEGTKQDCEIKDGKFISLDIFALIKHPD